MSTISQLVLIGIIGVVLYVGSLWGNLKRFNKLRTTGFLIGFGLIFMGSMGLFEEFGLERGVVGGLITLESIVILAVTLWVGTYLAEKKDMRLTNHNLTE